MTLQEKLSSILVRFFGEKHKCERELEWEGGRNARARRTSPKLYCTRCNADAINLSHLLVKELIHDEGHRR